VKAARRYLAYSILLVVLIAAYPFALIRVAVNWLFDSLVCPLLDSLEVIIDE
jgi:hypothetical protein